MLIRNVSQPGRSLSNLVDHYLAKAREQLEGPGFTCRLDAPEVQRRAAKVARQLAAAEQMDETPELLVIDGHETTRWVDLIEALRRSGYAALGASALVLQRHPAPARKTPTLLVQSLDALDSIRRRLTLAINGSNAGSAQAGELRRAVYGGRRFSRTRAGYQTEFALVAAALREVEKKGVAPNGVRRMRPLVESALSTLRALPPTVPGRPPTRCASHTVEVQVTTLALHLALGDLISHASATATDARLQSMNRVINARRAPALRSAVLIANAHVGIGGVKQATMETPPEPLFHDAAEEEVAACPVVPLGQCFDLHPHPRQQQHQRIDLEYPGVFPQGERHGPVPASDARSGSVRRSRNRTRRIGACATRPDARGRTGDDRQARDDHDTAAGPAG